MEVRIVADDCIGCAACVPECSVQAIELQDVVAAVNGELCIGCEDCIRVCPVDAIVPLGSEADRDAGREQARTSEPPPPAQPCMDDGQRPCACSGEGREERFKLSRWRPGQGDLRRRLKRRLGR